MKEVQIQTAKESGFEGIKQVINEHYATPPFYFEPVPPSEPADIVRSEKSIYFIAKVQEEIVGYLRRHRESLINEAQVESVVKPRYRNDKIGTRLLKHAIKYTKNEARLKRLIAKIKKGNDPSIRLVKNHGFRSVHEDTKGGVFVLDIVR